MDHFINLEFGQKFLFDNELYLRLEHVVYGNFKDDGSALILDTFNAVRIKDGGMILFQNDDKIIPL